jgi:hypothetical protein
MNKLGQRQFIKIDHGRGVATGVTDLKSNADHLSLND